MMTIRERGTKLACLLVAAIALLLGSGCATVPYVAGGSFAAPGKLKLRAGEPQVERGKPYKVLDFTGQVFGVPSKILLLNWKMDRHFISSETESNMVEYLAYNELGDVKIRLNQYSPGAEWSRLFRNKAVGGGWRYTLGLLSCAFYTVLPGRLFGGDHYNPFTDTINLYSDVPAVAIHEGAHAKDLARREFKGSYTFVTGLPLITLYSESIATGDAIGYLRETRSSDEEKAGYKLLYPAYATYIGGEFGSLASGWYDWIYLGAVMPAHIVGRIKAAHVKDRPLPQQPRQIDASSTTNAPAPIQQ